MDNSSDRKVRRMLRNRINCCGNIRFSAWLISFMLCGMFAGCHNFHVGAQHDRPFPLGSTSDVFWETQQTNAEASDFTFFDHEFLGHTAELAPSAKRHLESVALRLAHVPFPVVVEQSTNNRRPALDQERRHVIIQHLTQMGIPNVEHRVVIAPASTNGYSCPEAEQAYYSLFQSFRGGQGRRFGGTGGFFR